MRVGLLASLALLAVACGDGKQGGDKSASQPAANAPAAAIEKPKADFSGTVKGVVKLAEGAALPIAPDPHQPGKVLVDPPAPCSKWSEADRHTVQMAYDTGGLSPVHLAVTQMRAAPQRQPITHHLRFVDCRLTPTMLGAMVGDKVELSNDSDAPLLPVVPGDAFMQAMLKGQKRTFELKTMGPTVISCGFGAFCGESTIIAVSHPLYAVTDAKGAFEIKELPLDQDLVLHAWHPLFEVTSKPIRLSKAQPTLAVELPLKPRPAPAEPAAAPPKAKTGQKRNSQADVDVK